MEEIRSVADIWPQGVQISYWNQADIHAIVGAGRANFLNAFPSNDFLVAAAVGAVVIWFFARKMFNTVSFEPGATRYRVLGQLTPSQLRHEDRARRSYRTYALFMLAIFAGFTFFGEAVMSLLNSVPNPAGLQFDTAAIKFDSPSWPLAIAFGIVGLVPMFKPIETLELGIRRWVHRRAGIPVKLHDRCDDIVAALETEFDTGDVDPERVPKWLRDRLDDPRAVARTLEAFEHLLVVREWFEVDMVTWPSARARQDLAEVEQRLLEESRTTVNEFRTLLDTHRTIPLEDAREDDDGRAQAMAGRLIDKWHALAVDVVAHRNELVALVAVYAERDPDFASIRGEGETPGRLRPIVEKIFRRPPLVAGPEGTLLRLVLPVVFLIYALAVWTGLHAQLGAVELNAWTILGTAALETMKVAILFVFPIAAVMALRRARHEDGNWHTMTPANLTTKTERQFARVLLVAILPTILLLALLGLLWAVALAATPARLAEIYLQGRLPFVLVYPTLAITTVFHTFAVLFQVEAVDPEAASASRDGRWRRLTWGIGSALVILLLTWGHWAFWMSQFFETFTPWIPCGWTVTCFRAMGGLNLILYPLIAFLTIAWLISGQRSVAETRLQFRPRPAVAQSAILLAVALVALPTVGMAQRSEQVGEAGPKTIRVGFRSDAEPFSYKIVRDGDARYTGYIAELCHKIFAGDEYRVVPVEIEPATRFKRLKRLPDAEAGSGGVDMAGLGDMAKVPKPAATTSKDADAAWLDMLCDPTTLRYSLDDGREEGVFSPIVFVTGVSLIERRIRSNADLTLAYVDRVSAHEVVLRLCREDGFLVYNGEDQRSDVWAKSVKAVDKTNLSDEEKAQLARPLMECRLPKDRAEGDEPAEPLCSRLHARYKICSFESHNELIAWFCDGAREDENRGLYYVGDQEIIAGKYDAWLKKKRTCGSPGTVRVRTDVVLTYEPYALLVSRANGDLVAHVQRRVYEIFSNRSEALSLFRAFFPGRSMSVPLANLFLINGVEQPDCLQINHSDEEHGCPGYDAADLPETTVE